MKKSTLILICLTAVFASAGWMSDSTVGILSYIAAAISATAALVTAMKGAKGNDGRKKKD